MKEVNISKWNRKEIYEYFSTVDYPFYSITMPIKVTKVKQISKTMNIPFYHLMIWLTTKAINCVPALTMRIENGKLMQYDITHPSYTSMKKGEEVFKIITLDWVQEIINFSKCASIKEETQSTLFSEKTSKPVIYFSCLPWFDFCSLTNERNFDKDDCVPRITFSKYYDENKELYLHLSIDVNHRTVDGLHIGMFKENLDNLIKNI